MVFQTNLSYHQAFADLLIQITRLNGKFDLG